MSLGRHAYRAKLAQITPETPLVLDEQPLGAALAPWGFLRGDWVSPWIVAIWQANGLLEVLIPGQFILSRRGERAASGALESKDLTYPEINQKQSTATNADAREASTPHA